MQQSAHRSVDAALAAVAQTGQSSQLDAVTVDMILQSTNLGSAVDKLLSLTQHPSTAVVASAWKKLVAFGAVTRTNIGVPSSTNVHVLVEQQSRVAQCFADTLHSVFDSRLPIEQWQDPTAQRRAKFLATQLHAFAKGNIEVFLEETGGSSTTGSSPLSAVVSVACEVRFQAILSSTTADGQSPSPSTPLSQKREIPRQWVEELTSFVLPRVESCLSLAFASLRKRGSVKQFTLLEEVARNSTRVPFSDTASLTEPTKAAIVAQVCFHSLMAVLKDAGSATADDVSIFHLIELAKSAVLWLPGVPALLEAETELTKTVASLAPSLPPTFFLYALTPAEERSAEVGAVPLPNSHKWWHVAIRLLTHRRYTKDAEAADELLALLIGCLTLPSPVSGERVLSVLLFAIARSTESAKIRLAKDFLSLLEQTSQQRSELAFALSTQQQQQQGGSEFVSLEHGLELVAAFQHHMSLCFRFCLNQLPLHEVNALLQSRYGDWLSKALHQWTLRELTTVASLVEALPEGGIPQEVAQHLKNVALSSLAKAQQQSPAMCSTDDGHQLLCSSSQPLSQVLHDCIDSDSLIETALTLINSLHSVDFSTLSLAWDPVSQCLASAGPSTAVQEKVAVQYLEMCTDFLKRTPLEPLPQEHQNAFGQVVQAIAAVIVGCSSEAGGGVEKLHSSCCVFLEHLSGRCDPLLCASLLPALFSAANGGSQQLYEVCSAYVALASSVADEEPLPEEFLPPAAIPYMTAFLEGGESDGPAALPTELLASSAVASHDPALDERWMGCLAKAKKETHHVAAAPEEGRQTRIGGGVRKRPRVEEISAHLATLQTSMSHLSEVLDFPTTGFGGAAEPTSVSTGTGSGIQQEVDPRVLAQLQAAAKDVLSLVSRISSSSPG